MKNRAQGDRADTKRQHVISVRMDHGLHLGPSMIHRAMNETLAVQISLGHSGDIPGKVMLEDVIFRNDLRTSRAGQQKCIRSIGMANADMTVSIEHVFQCQDMVCENELADSTA